MTTSPFASIVTATAYADTEADYDKAAEQIPVPFERVEKALEKQCSSSEMQQKYAARSGARSVFIGSPDTVVGKLRDLQRDIGLSGVQLETNCAGLADHAAERKATGYWRGRSSRRSVERGFEPPRRRS
jgi:alkanesulfonate monooxygenase SsuD/methylene tetrahydromethanopterin reductase-like flavin-dependent oxidoreductase (luciferase family)